MTIAGYILGSKGNWYTIHQLEDSILCDCQGFKWRGKCRHIKLFQDGDYSVEMQFSITFTSEFSTSKISGEFIKHPALTISEVTERLKEAEEYLGKLLGMNVKIEQML